MEYLKRFYDGHSIVERYIEGNSDIHIHGLRGKRFECWVIHSAVINELRGVDHGQGDMFIRVGENVQAARPVASIVRLEALNRCLVAGREFPDVAVSPRAFCAPVEAAFVLFDRKLRSLLDASRIEQGKFKHEIVERSPEIIHALPDQDAQH